MKKHSRFFLSFLTLCILLLSCGCSDKNQPEPDDVNKAFEQFVNELWIESVNCDTLTLHYSLAQPQDFGITPCETTLGTYSQKDMTDSVNESQMQLATLKDFNYQSLTGQNQLIYDCILRALEYNIRIYSYPYYAEPLGPSTGLQAELPIVLAEYHFYTREDIEAYIELLKCLPQYFGELAQYEREKSAAGLFMSDDVADQIIEQCSSFIEDPEHNLLIECFQTALHDFDGLTNDERLLYEEANREAVLQAVIPAYEELIQTLAELKGTCVYEGGLCSRPDGAAYFEALTQYETGSSMTLKQMQKRLTRAVKSALMSMSAAQLTDSTLYDRYLGLTFPTNDPIEGLEQLKQAVKTDFPALPDTDYSVKYVHKSLQEYLSPAMYLIPPFDDLERNFIYINQNPENENNNLYTTLAHEGYPGHLYQNNYYLSTKPAPILHLLRTRGYTEGWGTYAELYGYSLAGFDAPLVSFLQDNMTAILSLYGLTEIGIHADGWSKEDTVKFWADYGIDAETATEIYRTILAEPGTYLPYCIGYLEICDLKDAAKNSLGDSYTELAFHTFFLNIGPVPFELINNHIKTELQ